MVLIKKDFEIMELQMEDLQKTLSSQVEVGAEESMEEAISNLSSEFHHVANKFKSARSGDQQTIKAMLVSLLSKLCLLQEKLKNEMEEILMKYPNSVQNIMKKITPRIKKCQDLLITFTDYGTFESHDKKKITWLKQLSHLKPEIIVPKNADCSCQKQKEKEEHNTKIMTSIQSKIESRQNFAVVFEKDRTAWIYELSSSDISWIEHTGKNTSIFDFFKMFADIDLVEETSSILVIILVLLLSVMIFDLFY